MMMMMMMMMMTLTMMSMLLLITLRGCGWVWVLGFGFGVLGLGINQVRQTWVTEYRRSLGVARQWSLWFLVSSPKDDEEAQQLRDESAEYGDIMLMSYLTEE
jgi:hypothetical protein